MLACLIALPRWLHFFFKQSVQALPGSLQRQYSAALCLLPQEGLRGTNTFAKVVHVPPMSSPWPPSSEEGPDTMSPTARSWWPLVFH